MAEEPLPSVFKTTAMDPIGRANPHPRLDRLRNECPVLFDDQLGGFFLTRYADAREILTNRTMLRSPDSAVKEARAIRMQRPSVPPESRDFGHPLASILFLDDPDHARIRTPFARAFNNRVARAEVMIREVAAAATNSLRGRDRFDIVTDFAQVIPMRVISRLLGVPEKQTDDFRSWAEAASLALHPMRSAASTKRMIDGQNALHDCLMDLIVRRRIYPEEDLISDLVGEQVNGAPLSDHEIQANVRLLLIAGNLTTTDLIGSAAWLLLMNPSQGERLRENPLLISRVIEEALRMESPIDATDRVASADMLIGGCPVRARQAITISLRAANRDPAHFDDPHAFRLDRRSASHLAFGGGSHFCLGAPLARLETQIALQTLLVAFPSLSIAAPQEAPRWRALPPFRGLASLPVKA